MQNCYAEENELCSTKEDKSECASKKQKDTKNEITYDVKKYFNSFNLFECERNVLDRLDVLYERACMAIQSTISDSAYFGSKEQIDAIRDTKERVDGISDSDEQVDVESVKGIRS